MKRLLTTFAVICSLTAFGQTAQEHFDNGFNKHKQQDLKGAIIDYGKAIKADNKFVSAYFNRGTCELGLKDFDAALKDFTKAIEFDPTFVKAYYSRATTYVSIEKYKEALPDLDRVIELDKTTPNALTLRGQLRYASGNRNGACDDFSAAKVIGDKQADNYIAKFCNSEQLRGESLMLDWPDSEKWKVGDNQENSQQHVIDLIHENETIESWTELGNMTSYKGAVNIPVEKAMNMMFEQAQKHSAKAKLTFIEKNETAENPWIIFTIESPSFKNDKTPESQLWFIIQGKQSLYTNFRAIKQATIPEDLKTKWTTFFKTGKIVYK